MAGQQWQFFIDVGGTFTDVVARRPDGKILTYKLLSSGAIRSLAEANSTSQVIVDSRRMGEPERFWLGYGCERVGQGIDDSRARVIAFDPTTGRLTLDRSLEGCEQARSAFSYALSSGEPAPVTAIRYLIGLALEEPIPAIEVRLGTTRATNALLERKGARVAFVTTKGFADVLKIGYQDRPDLFALNIRKRDELAEVVVEIDERLDASGDVLRSPDASVVRRQLEEIKSLGIQAIAICLLHAPKNPDHEELVADAARDVGFSYVSVSSRVARLERIVPRGDTTVVDAYLSSVVRDYVALLRASMPEAVMRLMSSHGGLMRADSVTGKDTILSGPAGGVVGCRHVARKAGFVKTIGFDMGGTSTDVSRIDEPPNEFEYTHETVKAGVRIMTPMLAVETVAAGGGSLCAFDGQKLVVGPHSAGSDPGPACYGYGGPLTVTDMNVILGRVVPEFFPFRLDRKAVEKKLAELSVKVGEATGASYAPISLAEGFIKIANANMAGAIKQISVAKGYDVRDYVLTTFGGAGAQHACAIARSLGMGRVLCSPFAGVLSAVGIGIADEKLITQHSVSIDLDETAAGRLESILRQLEAGSRAAMKGDGVDTDRIGPPRRSIDVCYAGQSTLITVSADPMADIGDRFEAQHRRLYGYAHEGRAVEVRVARVELVARSEHVETNLTSQNPTTTPSVRTTSLVVDGRATEVPLWLRVELGVGQCVDGPAVIIEDTCTIVVDPGFRAEVIDTGDIVLTDDGSSSMYEDISAQADPIQLELFNNQFASIAAQMGSTLRRTALSVNVKERLDFSCAIFTPEGDLVVNAPHIPVHLGAMSACIKALMEDVGKFEPGDVLVTNDPYRGGSHLNDVTVITPVHDESGETILFFVASRAHHAEIGGTRPGSMPPDSTSLAEEGVLIRAFRWIDKGRPQHDRLHALLTSGPYPSRSPQENLADVAAQVAANQTGVREIGVMMDRYGIGVVHSYMRHIQTAAQHKMRAALRALGDGVYRFEDRLDDGSPIRLKLTVVDGRATLDFRGTGKVLAGNLNANPAITSSAVLYCLRCLIDEDIPLNAGVMAPVKIILEPSLLNPPADPDPAKCPAVVGGNVETSQRIVDCVLGALQMVAASQGTMNNLLMGNDRFGYYETICGGSGAGEGFDGADAVQTNMTNTRLTDVEVLESRVPVRVIRFEIRAGSGGSGQFHGGCGVVRELEFLEPLEVSILSQRRLTAPYGLRGGSPGQPGRNLLLRAGSNRCEELPPIVQFRAKAGDRLTIETPGGGGWGKN